MTDNVIPLAVANAAGREREAANTEEANQLRSAIYNALCEYADYLDRCVKRRLDAAYDRECVSRISAAIRSEISPPVRVKTVEAGSVDQLELMRRGELHAAVGFLEGKETEFVAYPLPPVRLLVAYNPTGGFSFAKKVDVRDLADVWWRGPTYAAPPKDQPNSTFCSSQSAMISLAMSQTVNIKIGSGAYTASA